MACRIASDEPRARLNLEKFQAMGRLSTELGYFAQNLRMPSKYESASEGERWVAIFDQAFLNASHSLRLSAERTLAFAESRWAKYAAIEISEDVFQFVPEGDGWAYHLPNKNEDAIRSRATELFVAQYRKAHQHELDPHFARSAKINKWRKLLRLNPTALETQQAALARQTFNQITRNLRLQGLQIAYDPTLFTFKDHPAHIPLRWLILTWLGPAASDLESRLEGQPDLKNQTYKVQAAQGHFLIVPSRL